MSGDQGNLVGSRGAWEAMNALTGSQNDRVGWHAAGDGGDGCHYGVVQILVILNK